MARSSSETVAGKSPVGWQAAGAQVLRFEGLATGGMQSESALPVAMLGREPWSVQPQASPQVLWELHVAGEWPVGWHMNRGGPHCSNTRKCASVDSKSNWCRMAAHSQFVRFRDLPRCIRAGIGHVYQHLSRLV